MCVGLIPLPHTNTTATITRPTQHTHVPNRAVRVYDAATGAGAGPAAGGEGRKELKALFFSGNVEALAWVEVDEEGWEDEGGELLGVHMCVGTVVSLSRFHAQRMVARHTFPSDPKKTHTQPKKSHRTQTRSRPPTW